MSEDKRRSPRFRIEQMIKLDRGKETYIETEGINLSQHGLLCMTKEKIEPDTKVFFLLRVDHEGLPREVKCEGVVMRSEKTEYGYDLGVQISTIEEGSLDAFNNVIKKYSQA